MADRSEYQRKYNRERAIKVVPAIKDLTFMQRMQQQKPGMSKSAVAKYLIGLGVQQLTQSKNNF